jgi:capsule polysaccharide export protein KpsE/RkpR
MTASSSDRENPSAADADLNDGPAVGLADLLTWIGNAKRPIAIVTASVAVVAIVVALLLPSVFTARSTLLPPGSQQQSGSAAALAALGALGGLGGGLGAKTPDELYVALLKSDTVQRALALRFDLATRWHMKTYEDLRRAFANYVRISSDKKSGLISVEVDDEDPEFAAKFANAYVDEITKLMARLAVSEAQSRRVFFEQQLKDTKDHLIAAELGLLKVQETSGVIVLDKQAEALISAAARVRAQIAEREVMLSVLRRSATAQNPDVQRLSAELAALRVELGRMEAGAGGEGRASPLDMPVNKLSEAGIEYVRARRELKLQETLLESMIRQYEIAKLDEAKEGPVIQQVDVAVPPDRKSKPVRSLIVLTSTLLAALAMCAWAVWLGYRALAREADPEGSQAWSRVGQAWRWRRGPTPMP